MLRPLPPAVRRYAQLDTHCLLHIADELRTLLLTQDERGIPVPVPVKSRNTSERTSRGDSPAASVSGSDDALPLAQARTMGDAMPASDGSTERLPVAEAVAEEGAVPVHGTAAALEQGGKSPWVRA